MTKKFDYQKELSKYKEKAQNILKDTEKLENVLQSAEEKIKLIPTVGDGLSYIPTFIDMVRSYISGEYKEIPTGTVITVVAMLLYYISPIDLIPDFIPVLGILDDAALLIAGLTLIKSDLDIYKNWRAHKPIDVLAKPKKAVKKAVKQIETKAKPIKKKIVKAKVKSEVKKTTNKVKKALKK